MCAWRLPLTTFSFTRLRCKTTTKKNKRQENLELSTELPFALQAAATEKQVQHNALNYN
jgi:hypothetical protein